MKKSEILIQNCNMRVTAISYHLYQVLHHCKDSQGKAKNKTWTHLEHARYWFPLDASSPSDTCHFGNPFLSIFLPILGPKGFFIEVDVFHA